MKYVAVLQIDGQEQLTEWKGGDYRPVDLLPGEHRFRVEFKQVTAPTTIPIVDLATMMSDAWVAFDNEEVDIVFPLLAGSVHRIHYDDDAKVFYVSHAPTAEPIEPSTLLPDPNAAPCVVTPDRTQQFWCEVLPRVE